MPSEAQARITINKMLKEAGWRFLPDAQGRREDIICEHRVTAAGDYENARVEKSGEAHPPFCFLNFGFEKAIEWYFISVFTQTFPESSGRLEFSRGLPAHDSNCLRNWNKPRS